MINYLSQIIIILAVITLTPLIIGYLNKFFRKSCPTTDEISKILSKVDDNKLLKKKIEKYSRVYVYLALITLVAFTIGVIFVIGGAYSAKHGDNYPAFIILCPLVITAIGPIFTLINITIKKLFTIMNPDINPRIFEIYSAYYIPNKRFSIDRRVNILELNRKVLIILLAIFIPCLILSVIFAVI
jgi:hypothetical protein